MLKYVHVPVCNNSQFGFGFGILRMSHPLELCICSCDNMRVNNINHSKVGLAHNRIPTRWWMLCVHAVVRDMVV